MDGIINIYKEKGFTSHDVVAKLRGILHMKKIGHTGTLDPDAVGVLPVCLGKGTKLCDMLTDTDKTYEAVMLLGVETDTQDTSGSVIAKKDVSVTDIRVIETIASFVGEIDQIPPMYSALKINGKKLYELARQGIEVERKPRKIQIKSIHINDIDLTPGHPCVTLTVTCSKGTYIRTLCHDIGKKLGCGACMESLIRTRVGRFNIDESYTLNQIAALALKGEADLVVTAPDKMFDCQSVVIKNDAAKLLYNGNKIPADYAVSDGELILGNTKVYDESDRFIGIYSYDGKDYAPIKIFCSNSDIIDKEL